MAVLLLVVGALLAGCVGGTSGGLGGGSGGGLGGGSGSSQDKAIVQRRSEELLQVRSISQLLDLRGYLADRVVVRREFGDSLTQLLIEEIGEFDEQQLTGTYSLDKEADREGIYRALDVEYDWGIERDSLDFKDIVVMFKNSRQATASRSFTGFWSHYERGTIYRVSGVAELSWEKINGNWLLTAIVSAVEIHDSRDDSASDGAEFERAKKLVSDRMAVIGSLSNPDEYEKVKNYFAPAIRVYEIERAELQATDLVRFEHLVKNYLERFSPIGQLEPRVFVVHDTVVYSLIWQDVPHDDYYRIDYEWRLTNGDWRLHAISYGFGTLEQLW